MSNTPLTNRFDQYKSHRHGRAPLSGALGCFWNRLALPLLLAGFMIIGLSAGHLWAASAIPAEVRIDAGTVIGQFSPNLLGYNLQWTDNGDGLLDLSAVDQPDPSHPERLFRAGALSSFSHLPTGPIRFPGGLLSSRYVWRDGIGPQSGRGQGFNFVGAEEPMHFGTDEFLSLLKIMNTTGMITFSPLQPPSQAAAWLKYINNKGGGVDYWEFGNESFLPQDPSYMPVSEYVSKFNAFQSAIKAVDPQAKVGALLEGSLIGVDWGQVVVPQLDKWNLATIRGTAGKADFYTAHLYTPFDAGPDATQTLRSLAAAPEAMAANLQKIQALIARYAPGKELWITEFNVILKAYEDNWQYGTTLAQAGYISSLLLTMARNNVAGANYWSLVGNHNFGLIQEAGTGRERPTALVYRLFAPLKGAQAVKTTVKAPLFTYQVLGNVPNGLRPMLLDAQAFLCADGLRVMLVNRSPDRPLAVNLTLPRGYAWDATEDGQVLLEGPEPLSRNENGPEVVIKKVAGLTGSLTLPPGAVCEVHARVVRKSLQKAIQK